MFSVFESCTLLACGFRNPPISHPPPPSQKTAFGTLRVVTTTQEKFQRLLQLNFRLQDVFSLSSNQIIKKVKKIISTALTTLKIELNIQFNNLTCKKRYTMNIQLILFVCFVCVWKNA